jgi:hypothetical protein
MTENALATEDEWLAGVLPPKEIELLSIASDASFAHMFALKAGARVERGFRNAEALRCAGLQSRRSDPRRGTGADGRKPRRQVTALKSTPKATGVRLAMSR